jgi:hypothetical protein
MNKNTGNCSEKGNPMAIKLPSPSGEGFTVG